MLNAVTLSWVQSIVPANIHDIIESGESFPISNSVIWTERIDREDPRLKQIEKILLKWAVDMAIRYNCEPSDVAKNTQVIYREGHSERFHNQIGSCRVTIMLKKRG